MKYGINLECQDTKKWQENNNRLMREGCILGTGFNEDGTNHWFYIKDGIQYDRPSPPLTEIDD